MQEQDIVIKFRRSYHQLNYVKNHLTVDKLTIWANNWCDENKIHDADKSYFLALARAYADKELFEHHIRLWIKKKRKKHP